jgi:hypothetical protein
MAFIPLPNGFKIELEYQLNGQAVINIYHTTSALPVNTTNLTALANIFISWWQNSQRQNFSNQMSLLTVTTTDIRVDNGLQQVVPVTVNNAGTLAAAPAPNNIAVVMSWRTGFSGRSFRGRTYHAGILNTEVSDNLISTTLANNLLADATTLLSDLVTGGHNLVVFSQFADGSPRVTGVGTAINQAIIDTRIDTQRRRLPGTGE